MAAPTRGRLTAPGYPGSRSLARRAARSSPIVAARLREERAAQAAGGDPDDAAGREQRAGLAGDPGPARHRGGPLLRELRIADGEARVVEHGGDPAERGEVGARRGAALRRERDRQLVERRLVAAEREVHLDAAREHPRVVPGELVRVVEPIVSALRIVSEIGEHRRAHREHRRLAGPAPGGAAQRVHRVEVLDGVAAPLDPLGVVERARAGQGIVNQAKAELDLEIRLGRLDRERER